MKNRPLIGITLDVEDEYLRMKHHYSAAVHKTGGIPLMIPPDNDAKGIAELLDGLLIPGGADIHPSYYSEESHPSVRPVEKKRTEFEISLLNAVMELKKPILGICYGMQLINTALGGSLYLDIESQLPDALDHKSGTHGIKIIKDSFFSVLNSTFHIPHSAFVVNSTHHQAVKELGHGLSACAHADDNIIEALVLSDYPFLLGVQWHPERSGDELSQAVFRNFVESTYAHK